MTTRVRLLSIGLFIFLALGLVACGARDDGAPAGAADDEMPAMSDDTHMDDAGDEHEHDDDAMGDMNARLPNEGRSVRILEPADGATFAATDDIRVEIAVDQFALGEDGNHWHLSVDGASYAMVMGADTSTVLRGLEPGEHVVEVLMANGEHQDYEQGHSITITIR